jgi:hypothetical protein
MALDSFEPGWLHFEQALTHRDPAIGERGLSVAVVEDGVVFAVTRDGLPQTCTISFDDYDLLAHFIDHGRERPKP